jgi:prolyl-tRNA synthetase
MKYSKLFGKTNKGESKNETFISHKLLLKAGYIAESVAGRFFMLPLGMRVQDKIMKVIEEEMDNAGAQKMVSPVLHPLELWKETNRTKTTGFELLRIKDRRGAEFALGGTAEEMFVDVVRKYNISYKDLPFNIYQFSSKFRDELRARGGLLRAREFMMKDAYSFDVEKEGFDKEYKNMWDTYVRIFNRLGLEVVPVEADNGYIGGEYSHEFVVLHPQGESNFFVTKNGKCAVHEDIAKFKKEEKNLGEKLEEIKEVKAVRGNTMEEGVKLHGKPLWQQIKDVMYIDEKGRYILAIIMGDLDVNEIKLKKLVNCVSLEHASEEDIVNKLHSVPGFISPVGIKKNSEKNIELIIVADDSLRTVHNSYGGSNKKNIDMLNINIDRDYKADIEGDVALVKEGYLSLEGEKYVEQKGIEVGNIFQLGNYYTKLMKGAVFTDKDGKQKEYYMGCYGIGIGRTLATIVEQSHDEKGIIWPENIAPYKVYLIHLGEEFKKKAEELYNDLIKKGVEVLWDDRDDVTAGEKFNDADLIGVPLRVVISRKSIEQGGVEIKKRNSEGTVIVNVLDFLKEY